MSDAKHTPRTPGPWELDDDGGIRAACGGCVGFVQPHGNVNTIARTGETFSGADGRLIAAAPDLLAACQAMLAHGCGGDFPLGRVVAWEEAVSLAEAAIAKATGGPA